MITVCMAGVFGLTGVGGGARAGQPSPAASDQAAAIAAYVADRLAVEESEIRVRMLRPAMGREAESGAKVVAVKETTPGMLLGRAAFILTVAAEGRPATPRVVTATVERLEPIVVAAKRDVPVIRRGDRVTVRLQSGSLTIVTVGRAKADGVVGRQIPVTNVDSNKVVYGRVMDASTVAVQGDP